MTLFVICVVILLIGGGYLVGALDGLWTLHLKRLIVALVAALMISTVLYAAEIRPAVCDDYEKYSLLWYANLCFLWEHSS